MYCSKDIVHVGPEGLLCCIAVPHCIDPKAQRYRTLQSISPTSPQCHTTCTLCNARHHKYSFGGFRLATAKSITSIPSFHRLAPRASASARPSSSVGGSSATGDASQRLSHHVIRIGPSYTRSASSSRPIFHHCIALLCSGWFNNIFSSSGRNLVTSCRAANAHEPWVPILSLWIPMG